MAPGGLFTGRNLFPLYCSWPLKTLCKFISHNQSFVVPPTAVWLPMGRGQLREHRGTASHCEDWEYLGTKRRGVGAQDTPLRSGGSWKMAQGAVQSWSRGQAGVAEQPAQPLCPPLLPAALRETPSSPTSATLRSPGLFMSVSADKENRNLIIAILCISLSLNLFVICFLFLSFLIEI